MQTSTFFKTILLLFSFGFFAIQTNAQGIISITPDQGDAGATVSVTIVLGDAGNSSTPPAPLPPSDVQPTSVKIGTIEATTFNRTDETTVTASFDIPDETASANYDVTVALGPNTYTLTSGFKINGTTTIYYIDATNGSDNNDGLSWANAKQTVQAGIDGLSQIGGGEVWVKAGTYYPTSSSDRAISITIATNVKVYGGFAGTETDLNQRTNFGNGEANETILSGDIGETGTNTDNSYHLVVTSNSSLIDGFTFTKAYANGENTNRMGGAIYLANDPATVSNCHFTENYAEEGAAMYIFNINGDNSNTTGVVYVTNCSFSNNTSNLGGALVFRVGASSEIENCTFTGNTAEWRGGAIFVDYGAYESNPIKIINSTFTENNSKGNGGAIYVDDMASQLLGTYYTITECQFTGNTATYRGGAISVYNTNNFPTINGNTFTSNSAGLLGNAIAGDNGSSLTITNNTFNSNQDINLDEECTCSGGDCP